MLRTDIFTMSWDITHSGFCVHHKRPISIYITYGVIIRELRGTLVITQQIAVVPQRVFPLWLLLQKKFHVHEITTPSGGARGYFPQHKRGS